MKLNFDCVRDFLLKTEESVGFNSKIPVVSFANQLTEYSADDIYYVDKELAEEGFITVFDLAEDVNNAGFIPEYYYITGITFK